MTVHALSKKIMTKMLSPFTASNLTIIFILHNCVDAGKHTYVPSAEHTDDMNLALAELGTLILMNHSLTCKQMFSHTSREPA